MFEITGIQLNHQKTLMGVTEMPSLSWSLESDKRCVEQVGYEWQVSMKENFSELFHVQPYEKEKQSINNMLSGFDCQAFTKYYIRIRALNNYGEWTDWAVTSFVTGLTEGEFKADMISMDQVLNLSNESAVYLRKEMALPKKVESVYCAASAFGLYQLFVNGRRVKDYHLTPGWTSYKHHLMYQVYDLTDLMNEGLNTIGAILGSGWYKGSFGFVRTEGLYGDATGFICELHVKYSDGSVETIGTDGSWKGQESPILMSNIYDGETYDARNEIEGWSEPGLDDRTWTQASVLPVDKSILKPQICEQVEVIDRFKPQEMLVTPRGETVLDFGQNMSGYINMSIEGCEGDEVELTFFEVLDKDGNVYLDNLRSAKQTVKYIFGKKDKVVYRPSFTFQGFRYVWIKKHPGKPDSNDFTAHAISSAMERTGYIVTSDVRVNQLMHNILWGLNGNFVDIPTDCPQRDERLGWTGDAQVFSRTACFLKNTYSFYKKYLKDLAYDQTDQGGVPHVVPDVLTGFYDDHGFISKGTDSAAGWGDAAVIIPWTLYEVYGDRQILEDQYDSMKKWIDFMEMHSEGYFWSYKLQFGDWVALDAEEGSYFGATPDTLTCIAYNIYSLGLFIKTAKVLGKIEDSVRYSEYREQMIHAYRNEYFDNEGHMTVATQTAHIVSLYFGIVPPGKVEIVVEDLVKLLGKEEGHLVTGFLGTPHFCHVLSDNGRVKEAYDLFLKDDFPSWLYQVKMGATTIWEHWDGIKPDGSMWSPNMNSFNHYAYGAVGEWVHRSVAGIDVVEEKPGYSHFKIQPLLDSRFTFVEASLKTQFGVIKSKWTLDGDLTTLRFTVPVNTTCHLNLRQAKRIVSSDIEDSFVLMDEGYGVAVGSGTYVVGFII